MVKYLSFTISVLTVASGVVLIIRTLTNPVNLQTVYTGKIGVAAADSIVSTAALSVLNGGILTMAHLRHVPGVRTSMRVWMASLLGFAMLFAAGDVYATRELKKSQEIKALL